MSYAFGLVENVESTFRSPVVPLMAVVACPCLVKRQVRRIVIEVVGMPGIQKRSDGRHSSFRSLQVVVVCA